VKFVFLKGLKMIKTTYFVKAKCPRCGSSLLSNGDDLWCSFVGGGQVKPCEYGVTERVVPSLADELTRRMNEETPVDCE
jgi:hypothetical protein